METNQVDEEREDQGCGQGAAPPPLLQYNMI